MWGSGFFKGMAVTLRNMFRGPITLQYPEQREQLPERARWALTPKYDEEGKPKCTACEICVRTCPDYILSLDYHKNEDGTKHIDSYRYEIGACMFCGLCVEACPFDAIEMGKEYELACTDTACLKRELLHDVPAAGPKRKAAAAKPAAAASAATEGHSGTGGAPSGAPQSPVDPTAASAAADVAAPATPGHDAAPAPDDEPSADAAPAPDRAGEKGGEPDA